MENSKTVASPNQSKPTFPMTINTSSNKFQTSKPMPSSSTFKPTVPESVKQVSFRQSNFIFNTNYIRIVLIYLKRKMTIENFTHSEKMMKK